MSSLWLKTSPRPPDRPSMSAEPLSWLAILDVCAVVAGKECNQLVWTPPKASVVVGFLTAASAADTAGPPSTRLLKLGMAFRYDPWASGKAATPSDSCSFSAAAEG